jgi:hypothetical protein
MTDLDVYQPAGGLGQYQAGIVMTPESAKALDEQVRLCTEAVLREGTDYGIIPGTSGEKTLWRPGAQKLMQWFGLGYACERVEVERDDEGRKHGITYKCTVARRLPDGTLDIKATCEGTADYDESKFYQSAEQVQRKAEDRERAWAAKDGRPARPTKWQGLGEYRADWNALMKRAQKRAIVGAVNDATAAGGIFSDREEDDAPAPQDDGPSWYEQALEAALTFTDTEDGRKQYVEAAHAARDGQCTPRQANHVQNRIQQRVKLLKTATVTDVEDLGQDHPAGQAEDYAGSVTEAQLTKLHTVFTKLGFSAEDREQKLVIAETIIGRAPLTGPAAFDRSSKNLSLSEASKLIDTLDGFGGDREKLIAFMAEREQDGDSDG